MNTFNERFVEEGYGPDGVLNKFNIKCNDNFNFGYDVIDEIAKLEPNRRALVWCNDKGEQRTFTYKELSDYSTKTANMLLAHGVRKGDKVLCVLKRHYQAWFVTLGLCKIGAVLIPATNQLLKKDFVYRFKAADVSFTIATIDDNVTDHIDQSLEEYKGIKQKFIVRGTKDGWVSFDEEIEKYPTVMERIENKVTDDMLLYFSSGTTGYPKMVMHSNYYSLAHLITAKHWHHLDGDSLHLTISESGWGKFMWGKMYGQFLMCASVFVYDFDRFHAGDVLAKIQEYKVTSLCAPPTMFRFFMQEGIEKYDLSSLRYTNIAGEALNPEIFNRWYEYTGLKLMEGFGQTETVLSVANLYGMTPKPGSMGKPVPLFDADIYNEDGKVVAEGETGEICIRTTGATQIGMFKCYYNNPEATANAWHDNLYHTGDTAWKDEDGYFWYVGRTDDLIKSSGYRIGPFEIESVLMEHPAVLEVAVTGVKDAIRGQVVKATIVLTPQYKGKGDDALIKELQTYVKNATAPYKYPRVVEFVDELPKTISGKVRRAAIRENDNNK